MRKSAAAGQIIPSRRMRMRREGRARGSGRGPDAGAVPAGPGGPRPALLGPLLLYSALAAVGLLPLCWEWERDAVCGDWVAHACGVLEYRAGLAEGQFPVHVA